MNGISKNNKKIIAAVAICAAVIVIIIAAIIINIVSHSVNCTVEKTANGSIALNVSAKDLADKGIEVGDSVNINFNTGYNVEDVAILNGSFMNPGSHIIVVENENSKPVFQIQNIDDVWGKASMAEDSVAHFTLSNKGKFKKLNEAFKKTLLVTSQNCRSLRGGNLKLLDLFRGSVDINTKAFTSVSAEFMNQLSIVNNTNLSNNSYGVTCFNIKDINCNKLVKETLLNICNDTSRTLMWSNNEDLTAYTCAIIEAIAGASYDEIVADYMETYKNYYGITKENAPEEYEAIKTWHIDAMLHQLTKTPLDYDLHKCDFAYAGEMYLRAQQVHTQNIEKIKSRLCQ